MNHILSPYPVDWPAHLRAAAGEALRAGLRRPLSEREDLVPEGPRNTTLDLRNGTRNLGDGAVMRINWIGDTLALQPW